MGRHTKKDTKRSLAARSGRFAAVGLAICAVMFTAAGCGGTSKSEPAYDTTAADDAYMDNGYGVYDTAAYAGEPAAETVEEYESGAGVQTTDEEASGETVQAADRKLIRTVDLYTETERYDELLAGLEDQIASLGGYVEYRYQYNGNRNMYVSPAEENTFANRSSTLTVRIPSDRLDEFIGRVGEESNIVNKEERVEDVTLKYVDLESHKNALETEQERLMELMDQAETVEDLIAIESRLSEVRYELESMESQIRTLKNQVIYSTVNLNVQEVRRLTPVSDESIWGRIRQGLSDTFYDMKDGLQNGFVGFVVNLPYIVLWLAVLVILFLIGRALWRAVNRRRTGRSGRKAKEKHEGSTPAGDAESGGQTEDIHG